MTRRPLALVVLLLAGCAGDGRSAGEPPRASAAAPSAAAPSASASPSAGAPSAGTSSSVAAPLASAAPSASAPSTAAPSTAAPSTAAPSTAAPSAGASSATPVVQQDCGFQRLLLRVTDQPMGSDASVLGLRASRTEIAADGHYCILGAKPRSGKLTPAQRFTLNRAIARARFDVPPRLEMCDAMTTQTTTVEVPGKKPSPLLSFSGPCGSTPHATIYDLLSTVHKITHP